MIIVLYFIYYSKEFQNISIIFRYSLIHDADHSIIRETLLYSPSFHVIPYIYRTSPQALPPSLSVPFHYIQKSIKFPILHTVNNIGQNALPCLTIFAVLTIYEYSLFSIRLIQCLLPPYTSEKPLQQTKKCKQRI